MRANRCSDWWRRWALWWGILIAALAYVVAFRVQNRRICDPRPTFHDDMANLLGRREREYKALVADMDERTRALTQIARMENPKEQAIWLAWYERHRRQLPSSLPWE